MIPLVALEYNLALPFELMKDQRGIARTSLSGDLLSRLASYVCQQVWASDTANEQRPINPSYPSAPSRPTDPTPSPPHSAGGSSSPRTPSPCSPAGPVPALPLQSHESCPPTLQSDRSCAAAPSPAEFAYANAARNSRLLGRRGRDCGIGRGSRWRNDGRRRKRRRNRRRRGSDEARRRSPRGSCRGTWQSRFSVVRSRVSLVSSVKSDSKTHRTEPASSFSRARREHRRILVVRVLRDGRESSSRGLNTLPATVTVSLHRRGVVSKLTVLEVVVQGDSCSAK
ncbi:hypothetical protein BCR35DRAFT_179252 [Leucosporidium creatinivorum]|uniref:Uncharacterized protein n=1 Tax=Leucosporidium creatinivorum TaxID=106004 RepID=A0A1Y2EAT9_9BASI|nr:hypothetical protein BCR35DRAFT_179252 [Leucosporidium creatinivorum]